MSTREWLERAELERLLWALQDDLGLNATEDIVADVRAARLGLAARWNDDASINCMAWAWNHGMSSHWRPWEQPASNWLRVLPPDPRDWLWGQAHYPGRD